MGPPQGRRAGLRQAQVAHLSGPDEFGHGADHVLDGHLGVDPVLVEQVDAVGPQSLQRLLDHRADALGPAVEREAPLGALEIESELGREYYPVASAAAQHPPEEFLVGIGAVNLGGIEQGHARFDGLDQGGLALGGVGPGGVDP